MPSQLDGVFAICLEWVALTDNTPLLLVSSTPVQGFCNGGCSARRD